MQIKKGQKRPKVFVMSATPENHHLEENTYGVFSTLVQAKRYFRKHFPDTQWRIEKLPCDGPRIFAHWRVAAVENDDNNAYVRVVKYTVDGLMPR